MSFRKHPVGYLLNPSPAGPETLSSGLTLKATETRAFRSPLPCGPVGPDKRSYYKGALLAAKHSPSFS